MTLATLSKKARQIGVALFTVWLILICVPIATGANPPAGRGNLVEPDIDLPSLSTGSPTGTLAVRVHTPKAGRARYLEGAPVIIWVQGGFEIKGINHGLPPNANDVICVTFIYPGGEDPFAKRRSDGAYDYRGEHCIEALRDVILYAAGRIKDSRGRTIDELVPIAVLHDNTGLIGESNGGNIIVAVAALFGDELAGHLRYLIQWETPVSSQIATRDLGRVWMKPTPQAGRLLEPALSELRPNDLGCGLQRLDLRSSSGVLSGLPRWQRRRSLHRRRRPC